MALCPPDIVTSVGDAVSMVRGHAEDGEASRRVPDAVVRRLKEAGIYRLLVPATLGGLEHDAVTFVRVIEALAAADGSSGWFAMIAGLGGLLAGLVPAATAKEVWEDPDTIVVGPVTPLGRAVETADGFVINGRWPLASGCEHASWIVVGCIAEGGDAAQARRGGRPYDWRLALLPAAEVRIHDTWSVSGLCATGSHDVEVQNVLVPARRVIPFGGPPVVSRPLYAFPSQSILAIGVASVALGIARSAIDELVQLAATKIPVGALVPLAERASAQIQLAQAEAAVRAARAFVLAEVEETWAMLSERRQLSTRRRALVRLACTNATLSAAHAVALAYTAAGSTANYRVSPLQRQLRDIHAVTQHFSTAPPSQELLGRVLFSPTADSPLL